MSLQTTHLLLPLTIAAALIGTATLVLVLASPQWSVEPSAGVPHAAARASQEPAPHPSDGAAPALPEPLAMLALAP